MDSLSAPMTAALLVVLATVVYIWTRNPKEAKPGLRKLPLLGDLHKSPVERPLQNWDQWSKGQGSLKPAKLFGIVPVVVINTSEAVNELFKRRSQWYSNRPPSTSMELITDAPEGRSRFTLMHDYDAHLKLHHRLLSPSLGAVAAPQYQPMMELESKQLVWDLLDLVKKSKANRVSTKEVYPLLERAQSSVILSLHYGIRIPEFNTPILHEIMETQADVTALATSPWIIDLVPALRLLPEIVSPWKRTARKLFAKQLDLYMRLFETGRTSRGWNATKQAIATAEKQVGAEGVPDIDFAFTLATSIQGGMETSPRQMLWLFVAALRNKAALDRAHQVLDSVVGRDRLPLFRDRPQLTYIDAIMHEVMRWRPIAPGAIPRRADKEDEYEGVKIPKGVIMVANAWAIGRDEEAFDPRLGDVNEFVPERWIDADGKLNVGLPLPVFGQGRRMCQGKRVALDGTFMQMACILWAYDVEVVDTPDPWNMEVTGSMTAPSDFVFKLKPRGQWVEDVIRTEWAAIETDLGVVMGESKDIES